MGFFLRSTKIQKRCSSGTASRGIPARVLACQVPDRFVFT